MENEKYNIKNNGQILLISIVSYTRVGLLNLRRIGLDSVAEQQQLNH